MKKSLFILAAAAFALTACNNDEIVEKNTKANQPKEITFAAFNQKATRAAIDGTEFPTTSSMQVAAWDVTNGRDFFTATDFSYSGSSNIWKGGKYWPLSAATINFLAYAELNAGSYTWDITDDGTSQKANGVVLVMADNRSAQKDLMYACGTGTVSQSDNALSFPANVPMTFKHAQAWVRFMADAYDATTGGKVTLNSITLNGAKYNGTFTVTHTNYNAASSQSVTGAWSALGSTYDVAVPNWSAAAIAYDGSGDGVNVGDGLLIVPDDNNTTADFTSFTINYTLDGNTYNYTYTPATAAAANVEQAKKYTFKINFHLHEIEIAPEVTDWVEGGPTAVPVF